jgi:hypothetical protein
MQELALEHIQAMLIKETDPVRRRTLELHYLEIAGELANADIEKSKELISRWEQKMPYAPLEMYLLLFERTLLLETAIDPLSQSQDLLMSAIDETEEAFPTLHAE